MRSVTGRLEDDRSGLAGELIGVPNVMCSSVKNVRHWSKLLLHPSRAWTCCP